MQRSYNICEHIYVQSRVIIYSCCVGQWLSRLDHSAYFKETRYRIAPVGSLREDSEYWLVSIVAIRRVANTSSPLSVRFVCFSRGGTTFHITFQIILSVFTRDYDPAPLDG